MTELMNSNDLGSHLFLTRSRIADLKKLDILVPEKGVTARGRGGGDLYNADLNRERYIKFLRKMKAKERGKLSGGQPKSSGSTTIEGFGYDEKLKQEQWREKKRKNDIAENQVIPIDIIQVALMRVASKTASIINKISPTIHRLWPNVEEELMEVIDSTIERAMSELSGIELTEDDLTTEEEVKS